jgi:hypothetical protein
MARMLLTLPSVISMALSGVSASNWVTSEVDTWGLGTKFTFISVPRCFVYFNLTDFGFLFKVRLEAFLALPISLESTASR